MKKLICIILFAPFLANSQNWNWSLHLDSISGLDTIIQWNNSPNIAGFGYSFTFVSTGLDSNVIVDIGGSNYLLDSLSKYAYESSPSTSFPDTLVPSNMIVITNGDTTYQKTLNGYPYYFPVPLVKITKDTTGTDGTGRISGYFKFYKQ